jgi:hypothetical protein
MTNENGKNIKDILADYADTFNEVMDQLEIEQEEYWNSLSKEQQLNAFCAVARRIYKGDIELNGSYRYVLYEVFGFGPEAYAPAQMAGYLEIHNAIFTASQERKLLEDFAKFNGLTEESVGNYYKNRL